MEEQITQVMQLLTSINDNISSILLLAKNAYNLFQYFLCIFIIYQLYKFFSHFIFGRSLERSMFYGKRYIFC